MKQVFQDLNNGNLLVEDIPIPTCSDNEVIIETTCSLISPGTERFLINFGQESETKKVLGFEINNRHSVNVNVENMQRVKAILK